MLSPCYNCKERLKLCHCNCVSYLQYRQILDDNNKNKLTKGDALHFAYVTQYKVKKERNLYK